MSLSGILQTPSDVEVYINDTLVKREHLSPGEFEFLNLPNAWGSGNTTLVIKDAFGREERITRPFYLSSTVLKPGLQDYSYNLGFQRELFGQRSFDYKKPAFLAFHRIGLSNVFTGGVRAEADKERVNIGPTSNFLISSYGELDASAAFSRTMGKSGYGGILSYLYVNNGLSVRFSMQSLSTDYANLSLEASQSKSRFESLVGLGFNQKYLGSLSITFTKKDRYLNADSESILLSYTRGLGKDLSLYVTATQTKSKTVNNVIFVGLNFVPGKNKSASLTYQLQENTATETATFQQNTPLGTGFGYRFVVDRTETQGTTETGSDAFLQYNSSYGVYSAEHRSNVRQNSYDLNLSGGMALINHSIYFSRPITDSFALVKTGNLNDVEVYSSNEKIGLTHGKGELLVPNLISNFDNSISIEDKDIPVNYNLPEVRQLIFLPYRGGGTVKFEITRLQGLGGRLFYIEKGEKKPAEYWGLVIKWEEKVIEATAGTGGEFYLENIPPGKYPAKLFSEVKECHFDVVIPESNEMMVNLGDLSCEIH